MIYRYLADTEERIILGRRFVEVSEDEEDLSLDECFDEAVALHPLSMTCHQMRDEFQDLHFSYSYPKWVLVVNNFDIQQLALFDAYPVSGVFFECLSSRKVGRKSTRPESIVRY